MGTSTDSNKLNSILQFTSKANRFGALGPVITRQILPSTYVSGAGALQNLPDIVSRLGERPVVIHGDVGWQQVKDSVLTSLPEGATDNLIHYHGYCTEVDINRYAEKLSQADYDLVIAVGGGKVLDLAKGAAFTASIECITVPTSPATCACIAPLSVIYGDQNEVLGVLSFTHAFAATIIDTDVIGAAPARLLASGILDALAKWHEVRLSQRQHGRLDAPIAASLSLCDSMKAVFDEHAQTAIDDAKAGQTSETRAFVAESAILFPGLMSGLAGNGTRIAASHPVHDALTLLEGAHQSLHGELVGFGILTEMVLDGRPDAEVQQTAQTFQALGQPVGLAGLGVAEALTTHADKVAERVLIDPFFQEVFAGVTASEVRQALAQTDALAIAAGQVAS